MKTNETRLCVGVVGLGLIGGSIAQAYALAGHRVLGFDRDVSILDYARLQDVAADALNEETLPACDIVFLCIYAKDVIEYLQEHKSHFSPRTLVIDCAGTKRDVCKAGFALAKQYGFTFVGGHPMAGSHKNKFKNSRANLFSGSPMVIVPPVFDDMALLARIKEALAPLHFQKLSITSAEEHDKLIAFTSQLAHIVSNAYIKSPTASQHKGFSAGSYKDLTRVAWLDEDMWTELFLQNKDNLLFELDTLLSHLKSYKTALIQNDPVRLKALLREGKQRKQEVDKR
jgi:prephenate dehydrogenase